ncbi:MAG: DUF4832 domain-containing protein [Bacteroidales bacterium]|nr:DUF4832 domain-containing protein [Bacteroidales bacterium]
MKKSVVLISSLAVVLLVGSCDRTSPEYPGMDKVSYTQTDEFIANPERGFYTGYACERSTDAPLTKYALQAARKEKRTLMMTEFWLKEFFESDISEQYLDIVRQSLQAFRDGGGKCILRFGYSNNIRDLNNPDADRPFDPTEEQVLRHISQLKPILQEYADIIYVLQAGFVGCWGEWHYTDHFIQGPQTEDDYLPRKHVTEALLDALPSNRQIELRTPKFKMSMYGWGLADTITRAEAHLPTTKARLAGHNDCFLANSSDQGTFNGPMDKQYWRAETNYTIMGGETCALSNFCQCDNAVNEVKLQHFSYIHIGYEPSVISYWKRNGCYDDMRRNLGYRFALTEGYFSKNPVAGEDYRFVIKVKNDGYASAMNPRDAEFVLTDASGKVLAVYPLDSDPRFWMPGETQVLDYTISIPSGATGTLGLYLNLPDPCENLRNNPLFSIAMANPEVWDEKTGYNLLRELQL